jgi:GNAT superfamily N-acetyltransferase
MISVKRAIPEQASILTNIALCAKRYWGYPERWIEIWTPQLTITPEFIAAAEVWVAEVSEEPVGFYALTFSDERAALEHFWIQPENMGHGIGRRLFEHALSRSRGKNCAVLEIESDPNAQGFYERMGASEVGERVAKVDGQPRILPVMEVNLSENASRNHPMASGEETDEA